jgi:hypothetical protein
MSELLIKRVQECGCPQNDCDVHGWDMRFCCEELAEHMAPPGDGGLFYVDSVGKEAVGLQMDVSGCGDELRKVVACPFCGARVAVVNELSEAAR